MYKLRRRGPVLVCSVQICINVSRYFATYGVCFVLSHESNDVELVLQPVLVSTPDHRVCSGNRCQEWKSCETEIMRGMTVKQKSCVA